MGAVNWAFRRPCKRLMNPSWLTGLHSSKQSESFLWSASHCWVDLSSSTRCRLREKGLTHCSSPRAKSGLLQSCVKPVPASRCAWTIALSSWPEMQSNGLNYFGIGEVEILRDTQTGEDYLIEINARPWLQYALAPASNHDFLGLVLGLPPVPNRAAVRAGKTWISLRSDLFVAFSRSVGTVRHGRLGLFAYLRSLVRCNVFALFDWRDLRPFLLLSAASMSRNALMLAFHFPPFAQSSGSIRTLSFVRQLPDHHWRPVVLTARPMLIRKLMSAAFRWCHLGRASFVQWVWMLDAMLQSPAAIQRGSRRRTAGIRGPRRRSLPDLPSSDAMEFPFSGPLFRSRAPCLLPWRCIGSPRFR